MRKMLKNKAVFFVFGAIIIVLSSSSCPKEVGEIARLDLTGAKYLFIEKTAGEPSQLRTQQDDGESGILFKIKEDGTIEQVIVYDEAGNSIEDVLVKYAVRVGAEFVSVGLIISGEEHRYLVRVSDGAVFSGDCSLPDDYAGKVIEDDAGNYYYKAIVGTMPCVVKLDPNAMTTQVISAQGDWVYWFDVDRDGNLIYSTTSLTYRAENNGHIYRFDERYKFGETDINRDTVYLFDTYLERILKLTHPSDSLMMDSVVISPPAMPYGGTREIIGKGNRVMLFMNVDNAIIRFVKLSLIDGSNESDSINLTGSLVGYQKVNDQVVYILIESGQLPYKNYTFLAIDISPLSSRTIYETADFEIKSFCTDEEGNIIANALNLNNGKSCVLKITPSGEMTIIQEGEDTITNLIRVG